MRKVQRPSAVRQALDRVIKLSGQQLQARRFKYRCAVPTAHGWVEGLLCFWPGMIRGGVITTMHGSSSSG